MSNGVSEMFVDQMESHVGCAIESPLCVVTVDKGTLVWLEQLQSALQSTCPIGRGKKKLSMTPHARVRRAKKLSALLEGMALSEVIERVRLAKSDPHIACLDRALLSILKDASMTEHLSSGAALTLAMEILDELMVVYASWFGRSKIDNARRERERACGALVKRMLAFKRRYPKLMVIRLDVGYGKQYAAQVDSRFEILDHWSDLLVAIKEGFAASFLGYAAKIEYGVRKGPHMHLMLLFNGSKVRQDVTIARLIGELWKNKVTKGAGLYHNSNEPNYKARFTYCGVGVFSGLDDATIAGFQRVADYLVKRELLVRVAMPHLGRVLRTGLVLPPVRV